MRALVIKDLPDISIYTVLDGSINGKLFLSENLKIGVRLQDVILIGARWEVVKAANEGKEVEIFTSRGWERKDHKEWYNQFYRITPEPPQPQYVPFTASDWEMFVGKVVKDNKWGRCSLVTSWDEADVFVGGEWFSYESTFKNCTFLDGSPFGKKNIIV